MSSFLPLLVTWLQHYGYIVLWGCIFLSSAGLPLPSTFLLLASGAFAVLGDYNIVILTITTVSAAVSGDSLGYLIGRHAGDRLLTWLGQQKRFRLVSPQRVTQSRAYFTRWGGLSIFLTRFLFSALGGIVNLIAGAERYSYRRFLVWDFCGGMLGALIPLLLGYGFEASWEFIGDLLGALSGLLLGLLVASFLLMRLMQMFRQSKSSTNTEEVNKEEQISSSQTH